MLNVNPQRPSDQRNIKLCFTAEHFIIKSPNNIRKHNSKHVLFIITLFHVGRASNWIERINIAEIKGNIIRCYTVALALTFVGLKTFEQ